MSQEIRDILCEAANKSYLESEESESVGDWLSKAEAEIKKVIADKIDECHGNVKVEKTYNEETGGVNEEIFISEDDLKRKLNIKE